MSSALPVPKGAVEVEGGGDGEGGEDRGREDDHLGASLRPETTRCRQHFETALQSSGAEKSKCEKLDGEGSNGGPSTTSQPPRLSGASTITCCRQKVRGKPRSSTRIYEVWQGEVLVLYLLH